LVERRVALRLRGVERRAQCRALALCARQRPLGLARLRTRAARAPLLLRQSRLPLGERCPLRLLRLPGLVQQRPLCRQRRPPLGPLLRAWEGFD